MTEVGEEILRAFERERTLCLLLEAYSLRHRIKFVFAAVTNSTQGLLAQPLGLFHFCTLHIKSFFLNMACLLLASFVTLQKRNSLSHH
jgi:hypothetical protein